MRQCMIYTCILLCVAGGSGCNNKHSTMSILKTPETQEPDDSVDAGREPFKGDNVEVRVTGMRYGQARVRELKPGEQAPAGKLLIVYLEIRNLSRTKKMPHLSWAKADGAFVARLQDEQSNGYAQHPFIYCGEVDGVKTTDGHIQPGETARDLVAFDVPIEKVKTLKMSLPGVHIGQKGLVRFTIPASMVERK